MTMGYVLGRQIVMKFQLATKASAFDMFTYLDPRAYLLNDLSNIREKWSHIIAYDGIVPQLAYLLKKLNDHC